MKHLLKMAFWFAVGYAVTTRVAPAVQAKYEAMDLDTLWEVYGDEDTLEEGP